MKDQTDGMSSLVAKPARSISLRKLAVTTLIVNACSIIYCTSSFIKDQQRRSHVLLNKVSTQDSEFAQLPKANKCRIAREREHRLTLVSRYVAVDNAPIAKESLVVQRECDA